MIWAAAGDRRKHLRDRHLQAVRGYRVGRTGGKKHPHNAGTVANGQRIAAEHAGHAGHLLPAWLELVRPDLVWHRVERLHQHRRFDIPNLIPSRCTILCNQKQLVAQFRNPHEPRHESTRVPLGIGRLRVDGRSGSGGDQFIGEQVAA